MASMALLVNDRESSSIVRSFAPADENEVRDRKRSLDSDEEKVEADEVLGRNAMEGETSVSLASRIGAPPRQDNILGNGLSGGWSILLPPAAPDYAPALPRFGPAPIIPSKKIRSWTRGRLLWRGSFGTVYEGINDDGAFIAVKEVSLLDKGSKAQEDILQLEREIALLSQFDHENIIHCYGTDKEESKLFIFFESVTHGSIASLYQKYHLQDTLVSSYTRQILNGLNYLHERNVVHSAIKCANILVNANNSIKLAGFGLAKISKSNDLNSCEGSVRWMAPEVADHEKTYGRAADIWSLGCTVLEMLTRQIPFPSLEWQKAFISIYMGIQPPIPDHISCVAQDFIRKCFQVDPNSRPSAAQLLEHPFVTRRPLEPINSLK